jgi:pimeloyl-ACP methyl ester carboxylesterase
MLKKIQIIYIFFILIAVSVIFTGCSRHKDVEVKKAKIGEIEIAYYTRGSGEPLVMIMGFRGTMAMWDPALLNALEKHFTLILFDNRGAGFSSDTEEDFTTIPQMADDTVNLIKALGYRKTHVLGWSMGSRIAQQLATSHPEIVDTLILCSPNPGGKYQEPRKKNSYLEFTSLNLSKEKALSMIYPDTPSGHSASASFVARLTKATLEGAVPNDLEIKKQTIERQIRALKLWDKSNRNYDALPDIKTPTLVAGGMEDILDEPENFRIVANRIPFAWSSYFKGAGHAFLFQQYQHFADLIILFTEVNH